jgi:hypothetical protein
MIWEPGISEDTSLPHEMAEYPTNNVDVIDTPTGSAVLFWAELAPGSKG